MNAGSSRSHCLVIVDCLGLNGQTGEASQGRLVLVDLAGSERVARSEASGPRLKEAQHINKSLSALGDVIHALARKEPYVPYRNSCLTRLLQASLGPSGKVALIVNASPGQSSAGETLAALQFASRARACEMGASRRHVTAAHE